MNRLVVLGVVAVLLAGCSTAGAAPQSSTPSATSGTADAAAQKADAALILTMYADINSAFARSPTEGLTALIATQYPRRPRRRRPGPLPVGAGHVADHGAIAGATKATTPAGATLKRLTYTPPIHRWSRTSRSCSTRRG